MKMLFDLQIDGQVANKSPARKKVPAVLLAWMLLGAGFFMAAGAPGLVRTAHAEPDCSGIAYDQDEHGFNLVEAADQLECIPDEGLADDYRLAKDITLEGSDFRPIGELGDPFEGRFDGDGRTITGLTIDRADENFIGLFGATSGAVLANVTLQDVDISGDVNVGGLVGRAVQSVVANNTVHADVAASGDRVGGLIGWSMEGTVIKRSDTSGSVSASGLGSSVGGLVGHVDSGGVVTESGSSSIVSSQDRDDVGGLVGASDPGVVVTRSSATGEVSGSDQVGGLVGMLGNGGIVEASHASGAVSAAGSRIGGLTGQTGAGVSIVDSYATGSVTGEHQVGGLVGELDEGSSVVRSNATGGVTGTESDVGGLLGAADEGVSVVDANATGTVSGDGDVGGLVGEIDDGGSIVRSFATGGVTGTSSRIGGLVGVLDDGSLVVEANATGAVEGVGDVGGLIGETGEASTVYRSNATGGVTSTDEMAGGLIGESDGSVVESFATGNVDGTDAVGGLVGQADRDGTSYVDSFATGAVSGNFRVGGFAGGSDSHVMFKDSNSTGSVTGTGDVGGFVGKLGKPSSIVSSNATGDVEATGGGLDEGVGGFVGSIGGTGKSSLVDSFAEGKVDGNSHAGGFVGYVTQESGFTRSYATGDVTATDDGAGGFVGTTEVPVTITDSHATGMVVGDINVGGIAGSAQGVLSRVYAVGDVTGDQSVGGLAGTHQGVLSQVYATGEISGSDDVGGLVGEFPQGAADGGYWDTETTTQSGPVGQGVDAGMVGLVTAEMTGSAAEAHMVSFDFDDAWETTDGYPEQGPFSEDFELDFEPGSLEYEDLPDGPTTISDWNDLDDVRDDLDGDYQLAADLDEDSEGYDAVVIGGFEPIGTSEDPFTGTLDGDDKAISDLVIDAAEGDTGLFGVMDGAMVHKMGFVGADVTEGSTDEHNVGVLAGEALGSVIRGVEATDVAVDGGENNRVGGLVGSVQDSVVRESSTTGIVEGAGAVGGLVGYGHEAQISRSFSLASVVAESQVGGLLGHGASGTAVARSNATGTVSGEGDTVTKIGGLVGENSVGGSIVGSYATGPVGAQGGAGQAGGLVGGNFDGSTIAMSRATGAVDSQTRETGGLAGSNNAGSLIMNSRATGAVDSSQRETGGLVGQHNDGSIIMDSKAMGSVSSVAHEVGGLVGELDEAAVIGSQAEGDVTQTGGEVATGGLSGQATEGLVHSSSASGMVTSDGDQVGGLLGFAEDLATVDSMASGGVEGALDTGGLVGEIEGPSSFVVSHAEGAVTSTTDRIGGFFGGSDSGEQSSFYASSATGGVEGDDDVGAFAGDVDGPSSFIESYATGDVDGSGNVGGFAGVVEETASFVATHAEGDVHSVGDDVGGLIGEVDALGSQHVSLVDVTASGEVDAGSDNDVGGLIGELDGESSLVSTRAEGTVKGSSDVGGLVGKITMEASVLRSFAQGDVEAADDGIGGLIGSATRDVAVVASSASGNVTGDDQVGGLLGSTTSPAGVVQAYSRGSVEGKWVIGGLVGDFEGVVSESYAVGALDGEESVGGLIGDLDSGRVHASYWDEQVSVLPESDGGEGLSTDEMQGEAPVDTMVGFGFNPTWSTTDEYPVLYWQDGLDLGPDPGPEDPFFEVTVESVEDPVPSDELATIVATIQNTGGEDEQTVVLEDPHGDVVDEVEDLALDTAQSRTFEFLWGPDNEDWGTQALKVKSDDDVGSAEVVVHPVGEVEILTCAKIDVPGTFVLGTDLSSSGSTCIEITEEDVTLDGGGHEVGREGPLDPKAYGIHVHGDGDRLGNVVLKDMVVPDWHGLEGSTAPGPVVYEDVDGGEITGFLVTDGNWGISVADSTGIHVHENEVRGDDFAGTFGIEASDTHSSLIEHNDVSGALFGVWLDEADDNRVERNLAMNNTIGVVVGGSHENTFTENRVLNSTLPSGFFKSNFNSFSESDGNKVENLSLGESLEPELVLSFEGEEFELFATESPGENPQGESLETYFEVSPHSSDVFLDVGVHYDGSGMDLAQQHSLTLWQFDGAEEEWGRVEDAEVNTTRKTVEADLGPEWIHEGGTTFGVFEVDWFEVLMEADEGEEVIKSIGGGSIGATGKTSAGGGGGGSGSGATVASTVTWSDEADFDREEELENFVPGADGTAFVYLDVEAEEGSWDDFESVNLSVQFDPHEVTEAGLDPQDMAVYYWNGEEWINTRSQEAPWTIEGSTSQRDREVFDAGVDLKANEAWVVLDEMSTFALGAPPAEDDGGGGGGGGGGGAPGAVLERSARATSPESSDASDAFSASGRLGSETESLRVDFPEGTSVGSLDLDVEGEGRVDVLVELFDGIPADVPGPVPEGFADTGPYVAVHVDPGEDVEVASGSFRLEVDPGALGDMDASQGVVLHGTNGDWVPVETALIEAGDSLVFEVMTPGFSPFVFALDTEPPVIDWTGGLAGEPMLLDPEDPLSAQVLDNRDVDSVEFFLDDEPVASSFDGADAVFEPGEPFAEGEHVLRVVATDSSGLESTEETAFVTQAEDDEVEVAEDEPADDSLLPNIVLWIVLLLAAVLVLGYVFRERLGEQAGALRERWETYRDRER